MKKLIGVSPRVLMEDNVHKQFVNTRYINPFHERGFNTIMLTMDNPAIENVLALCDAFIVTGGSDIDPTYFNETNDENLSRGIKPNMDTIDREIVLHAKKFKKPMLGICRGHQAINVFMGGSLFQDLGDKVPTHEKVPNNHEVTTFENSMLQFNNRIEVNSYHHQGVKQLADGFIEIAKHDDGTCEAIIHSHLPIIGIQWHPEMRPESVESNIIFDAFATLINNN